jgi:hypothetical protein
VILSSDGTVYVPQPLTTIQTEYIANLLKNGTPIRNPFGEIIAAEIQLDNANGNLSPLQPSHPLTVDFGGEIRLLGYDVAPTTIAPGDSVRVTYYWQSLVDVEFDYWVVSTLLDASSNGFGKRISDPVNGKSPTSLWRRGEIVVDSFDFKVDRSAHDGKYRFEVALISPTTPNDPLPITESMDRFVLGSFLVSRNVTRPPAIQNQLALKLGVPTLATLLGYDLDSKTVRSGDSLHLVLYWSPASTTTTDYSIFLHVVDLNGNIVAQQDGPPQNGNAPTSMWTPGDWIVDPHELSLPSNLSTGRYTLQIGVYDSSNGARVPIFDAGGSQIGDSWRLPIDIVLR